MHAKLKILDKQKSYKTEVALANKHLVLLVLCGKNEQNLQFETKEPTDSKDGDPVKENQKFALREKIGF